MMSSLDSLSTFSSRIWNSKPLAYLSEVCEHRVLETVRTDKIVRMVPISNGAFINTLVVGRGTAGNPKPRLVLLHGWGGGKALFSGSLDRLAEDFEVHALDMLGWGRSSRVPFSGSSPEDAQAYFVRGVEEWRLSEGIDEFTLMGYSLGGYVAAAYALDYPENVSRLVLTAPAGLGWDVRKNPEHRAPLPEQIFNNVYWKNALRVLRWTGPLGRYIVRLTQGSFKLHFPDHRVADYIYHINSVQASGGDSAFAALVTSHGWALALYDRLAELQMDVSLIYGEHDTIISPAEAPGVVKLMRGAPSVQLHVMRGTTHALFAEQPEHWENLVLNRSSPGECAAHCVGGGGSGGTACGSSSNAEQPTTIVDGGMKKDGSMAGKEMEQRRRHHGLAAVVVVLLNIVAMISVTLVVTSTSW